MKSTDNDRKRQKLEALAEQAKAGSKEAVEEILMQSQHTALIRSGWSIRLCQRTACRPGITCR